MDIFLAFYNPMKIKDLGGSEWGNDIYNNVPYLVVQNHINIFTTPKLYNLAEVDSITVANVKQSTRSDSSKKAMLERRNSKLPEITLTLYSPTSRLNRRKDSLVERITDFRPPVVIAGKRSVFLTPEYEMIINKFLGNSHTGLGKKSIIAPAYSIGESRKREKFISRFVKVFYGHWGNYWQLYSYPMVTAIIFDRDMQRAQLKYTMIYEGGEANLELKDGKWKLISAYRTWIE